MVRIGLYLGALALSLFMLTVSTTLMNWPSTFWFVIGLAMSLAALFGIPIAVQGLAFAAYDWYNGNLTKIQTEIEKRKEHK